MSLSCDCFCDFDCEDRYYPPQDFSVMPIRKRRTRCRSCKSFLNEGDFVTKFSRFRFPQGDIEVAIYQKDGEIPLASWYMCFDCGGIFLSLTELGFCLSPDEIMQEQLVEYQRDYAHPVWKKSL